MRYITFKKIGTVLSCFSIAELWLDAAKELELTFDDWQEMGEKMKEPNFWENRQDLAQKLIDKWNSSNLHPWSYLLLSADGEITQLKDKVFKDINGNSWELTQKDETLIFTLIPVGYETEYPETIEIPFKSLTFGDYWLGDNATTLFIYNLTPHKITL